MTTDLEKKDRARELYVYENRTLEQVARETDIPDSTIKRWSAEDGWFEERKAHRGDLAEIRRNALKLRRAFVEKAMNSLDPQDVYAVARLEALAQRENRQDEPGPAVEVDRPKLFLEDLEFVATTLKEIDPEGLKIFARNFDAIVQRFKSNHEGTKEGKREE